jgi:hypothetical protein
MVLKRIRVVHFQNLLVLVSHDYHIRAGGQAFLGARLSPSVGALCAAFAITHPPIHGRALTHVIKRQSRQGKHETHRKTKQQNFSHGRFSPYLISARGLKPQAVQGTLIARPAATRRPGND